MVTIEEMMKTEHELKIRPDFARAIRSGLKTWELRIEDTRHFDVGDTLIMRPYDRGEFLLQEPAVKVRVTYVLRNFPGIQPGYALMSIEEIESVRHREGGGA